VAARDPTIQQYSWLVGVQLVEFMTFNVESEFLSLFVHGYKTAESRGSGQSCVATTTVGGHFLQSSAKSPGQKGDKET